MLRITADVLICLACAVPTLVAYNFWPSLLWLGCTLSIVGAYYMAILFGGRAYEDEDGERMMDPELDNY
jgi:hypothetical protein